MKNGSGEKLVILNGFKQWLMKYSRNGIWNAMYNLHMIKIHSELF